LLNVNKFCSPGQKNQCYLFCIRRKFVQCGKYFRSHAVPPYTSFTVYMVYNIISPLKFRIYLKYILKYYYDFTYVILSCRVPICIANGYLLDHQVVGVRIPVGSRFFSSPYTPDRLWVPSSLVYNGKRWLFHRCRGVKLNSHFQLLSRPSKHGSLHRLPIRVHGVVVLSWLSTGTILAFVLFMSRLYNICYTKDGNSASCNSYLPLP
jgi:hypothetical protein